MPQRFLKPGIRNSERWNAVSWRAQSLYTRVLTLVDDFGRYDGRPAVIWSECFAIWNEQNPTALVLPQDSAADLQELAAKKLISLYEVDGKKVLQIEQWTERVRDGSKEKWPANPANTESLRNPADLPQAAADGEKSAAGDTSLQSDGNPQESAGKRCLLLPLPSSPPSSPPPPKIKVQSLKETDLVEWGKKLLGREWANDAGKWVKRIKAQASKVERVFHALKVEMELGNVKKSAAGYAETLWKKMEN